MNKTTRIEKIPNNWVSLRLGDVCFQRTETVHPNMIGDSVFVGLEHIKSGQTWLILPEEKGEVRSTKSKFYPGDILYGKLRPYLNKAVISNSVGVCSTDLLVLYNKKGSVISDFLIYILHSKKFINYAIANTTGTNHPRTSWKAISKFMVLLPPLPEQKKIAEILLAVDLEIEKLNMTIRKLERLKKELIEKFFTEGIKNHILRKTTIGMIPQSWNISKLGMLGELQYGYTCSASKENTGIKFLRITDIKSDGKVHWDSVPYCNINDQEFDKYSIKKEDILFTRIGASTGKTAFIELNTRGVFASYLIRFVRKVDNIESKYLFYFTQSRKYWSQVNRYKEGQLKKGLNASILGNIVIPIPPIREQKKISEFLNSLDYKLELLFKRKEKIQLIEKGLMYDLLTGRKRVRVES